MRYFSILVFFLLASCKIADLRTPEVEKTTNAAKGQVLLEAAAKAHGSDKWTQFKTYEVAFQDLFFGFLGKNGNPFPGNEAHLKLQYIPGTFDGRATFTKGKKEDTIWGIQSWHTYKQKHEEDIKFEMDKDIYFWLPTYQYFIEFPARITEASIVRYAGKAIVDDKPCDLVFATWNKTEPQEDIDQYLIYIDSKTKLIQRVDYTIREVYDWISGTVYFKDIKSVNGIQVPHFMPVTSSLVKKGNLHEMRILDLHFNTIPPKVLRPNENLKNMANSKPQE